MFFCSPTEKPYPPENNPLLHELSVYLETAGYSDPLEKIYTPSEPLENVGLLMFLFVIAHLPKFTYDELLGTYYKYIILQYIRLFGLQKEGRNA